jgi:signal transduction histidine kinase
VKRRINSLTDRDWRVIDRVFVAAIVVLGLIELLTLDEPAGVKLGSVAVVSAMALSLLWRRSRPVEMLACLIALALVGELFFVGPPGSLTQVLILLTANYSVGAHAGGTRGFVGLGVGVVGVTALAIVFDPSDIVFPVVFFVVTPWMFGRVLRNTLLTARELAERAELAEHAREEEESRAVMAERNRVARELHDVLAHNLSVVVVQAGAARRIAERDPERAAEVAALIELTGREALAELRHLFGPVRREDGGAHPEQPGLADLERLAARVEQAGLPVELQIDGEPVPLPAGVDLTAYRLVQESLTNALKHAGADYATVRLSYEPNELSISVEDDGEGLSPERLSNLGGGHGLAGMEERVALYGGLLQAGRRRGGGFAVRARLPTRPLVPGAELQSAPKKTVTA